MLEGIYGQGFNAEKELASLKNKLKETVGKQYSPEHQSILKKYIDIPKKVKKIFNQDTRVIIDSRGNTWYEFDIPKKFIDGKVQIKAFSTIPIIGTAGAIGSTTNNKNSSNEQ